MMGETLGADSILSPVGAQKRGYNSGGVIDWPLKNIVISFLVSIFLVIIFYTATISNRWVNVSLITGTLKKDVRSSNGSNTPTEECPEYFRWIYEDLKPWKDTGITKEMVEKAKEVAHIKIIIVDGRVYMEKYEYVFQSRDIFTVWGIVQLLRLYPGKIPDLELVFQCHDTPGIRKNDYVNKTLVPPLFHYCADDSTFDIVFPDWSFWGWPEINIKPWVDLSKDLEEGNKRIKWKEREPYAYWKGNIQTGARKDLANCNVSKEQDWNARIYHLNWNDEIRKGFKNTNMASQCTHKYKIYAEGNAWSVSEKYILACDSMSLFINPRFYDFFTRSLIPTVHYWPINPYDMCRSIKFAVDWGNKHTEKAQEIGKAGSRFIEEELKMKYVYDYMFHLLSEYAKLFKYRPIVTKNAIEVCSCLGKGLEKKYKMDSMVKGPSDTGPCTMIPPYHPQTRQAFIERKLNLTKQVQMWEATGNIHVFDHKF